MTDVNTSAPEGGACHVIFKILTPKEWADFRQATVFKGSAVDIVDGYIHLSTAAQARETAAKHFADQPAPILAAVDRDSLGAALRWEPSRGGALFPHLYAPLPLSAVLWAKPVPKGPDGRHAFPPEVPEEDGR